MREKATGSIFLGELALAFLALFRLCCYVVVHKLQNNDLFGEGMSATGGGQQQWTVMERSTDIQQHHHHNSNFNAEYHPQASDHQIAAAEQQTEIQAAAIELQLQRIEDRELEMLEGQRHHATMVEQEMYYPTDINILNEGRMDSWNTARDPGLGMSYFTREDLPFYYTLYDNFAVGDQYFQSTFTCTCPNRLHFFTGSNAFLLVKQHQWRTTSLILVGIG